jgi:anti-sigma28 factor (negative regulator of flagellin synthesis)
MPTKVDGAGSGTTTPVDSGQGVRRSQDSSVSDGASASAAPPKTPTQVQTVSITDSARQLQAVDEGTYSVDPEHVADKLMQMEQSLYVAGPSA